MDEYKSSPLVYLELKHVSRVSRVSYEEEQPTDRPTLYCSTMDVRFNRQHSL